MSIRFNPLDYTITNFKEMEAKIAELEDMLATVAAKGVLVVEENETLKVKLETAEQALLLIGEKAVVDWDDATVGAVDAIVKNPPQKYIDWLHITMKNAKRGASIKE